MDVSGLLSYLVSLAIMGGIYAIFALGLNVQWGYTGLFNIGIAGFFAVGAYTSALITTPMPEGVYATYVEQLIGLNLPFAFGLFGAMVVSAVLAAIVGIPTLRLREDYLAIATIGIAESIRLIFNNERWLANGPRGLTGLPQPLRAWVEPQHYNYLYLAIVLIAVVAVYWAIERGIRSPWGRVLRAIREDETAAAMNGKNVFAFKLQALMLGAAIMGLGGALYAHYVRAISPDAFTPLFATFLVWVMLMLGGSGNNRGAIVGAFVVWGIWTGSTFVTDQLLPTFWAARAPYLRFLLVGLILEAIILLRPQGILGEERRVSKLLE
ncbi:MAG TPA: branched-chain amino acid ABC transporter permease [Alphaproteobacteria bacterium]|nr:branched-chain amino acid ABC transporter permease [Alphaproteobacteria bacterium]